MQYGLFPRQINPNHFAVSRLRFSPMTQQTNLAYAASVLMFLRHAQYTHTHTHTHTEPVGLLRRSYQNDEVTTYVQHTIGTRDISIPPAGFEPSIPEVERLQTYASDRTVTGIGFMLH